MMVFDPTNYSQNVLTAARELQQVNNEIQSLENQAHDADQPGKEPGEPAVFGAAQLQAAIQRTQQLLAQAQHIAYDVTTIDQAFTKTYPQSYSLSTSSQQLITDAQTRWQNALAGFQDAMRVQAGVVQNLDNTRPRSTRWSRRANRRPAPCRPRNPATSWSRCRPSNSPT